ncbi:MAG: YidC/Oxa1 family membrane protein insertase [Pseudohongiellaceae bacterium]|jgi:YidC/Oxa1 family membrane protein insertase
MDWQKPAYMGGILVLSLAILFEWNQFKEAKALATTNSDSSLVSTINGAGSNGAGSNGVNKVTVPLVPTIEESDLPIVSNGSNLESNATEAINDNKVNQSDFVSIKTSTIEMVINRNGGDIVQAVLPRHKVKLNGEQGFTILDETLATTYIAQSGLIGVNGTDTSDGRPLFKSAKTVYELKKGDGSLNVDLTLNQNGVNITKRFTFFENKNVINVTYLIDNQSASNWQANFYGQIKRDSHKPIAAADSGVGVSPYVGAATTTNDDKYEKLTFSDLEEESQNFSIQGGWVAMVQHYFTSAWIPNKESTNKIFLRKLKNQDMYLLGFISPETLVQPGTQTEISARFYVGPKNIDDLELIAENLDLTIDFGFLWWIAKPIFHLLDYIHDHIGNWGWSIIVLTIIIKAIFFYPSALSYRSMAKMRKLSPKMKALKERVGDDKQKMSQEMMKLYKKEKVNPMGGCLPILIQMPVFISLYWVLMESVELRHAPFAMWITDLSVMDPYFIFPLVMGATMFIQQQLNPTPPDPMQAKIMKWMPVAFTFMFLWFPVGLVIYWVTNNTLSIIQQYIITKRIEAAD